MIEFKSVSKSFGSKKVLDGLSLSIPEASCFFILGRSGTGKSVALKHLVGLLKPDSGEVYFDSQRIDQLSEEAFFKVRRHCSLVFQLPALIDSRHLLDNLRFGIRSEPFDQQIAKIKEILPQLGLSELLDKLMIRYPPELSYGEQKRMAIARSLLIEPKCLLFDEPTTGMDPITSRSLHQLISDISRKMGKTTVVVSHDMKNALKTADHIVVMHEGQVVDQGNPKTLRQSQHPLTRSFLEGLSAA